MVSNLHQAQIASQMSLLSTMVTLAQSGIVSSDDSVATNVVSNPGPKVWLMRSGYSREEHRPDRVERSRSARLTLHALAGMAAARRLPVSCC